MGSVRLLLGDCLDVMRGMDADSVDAIVTDPPYGLSFMGKAWDGPQGMLGQLATGEERRGAFAYGGSHSRGYKDNVPAVFYEWCLRWATEALRVAKPGAHLLAFGGTRTFHRLACAIEDAGWEIRDTVMWVYGQGFPKGHRVDAAVRRHLGADGYCQCDASMRNSANTYPEPQRDAHRHTERPLGDDDHTRLDARRLSGKAPGSQAGYQPDHDSGDARPRTLQAHGLTSAPLLECAQEHNHSGGRVGGSDCEPEHTPSPVLHTDRLSSLGSSPLESAADGLSANRSASSRLSDTCESAGHIPDTFPSLSRLTSAPKYSTGFPCCPICGKPVPERYEGWNVALKPAWEPIILARKPLQGTVAANVLAWGTGALNVDGCRVGTCKEIPASESRHAGMFGVGPGSLSGSGFDASVGRWPANFIHDGSEEVLALMPNVKAGVAVRRNVGHSPSGNINYATGSRDSEMREDVTYADSGSAARFFYCAKSSRADRNSGLDCTSTVKYDVPVGGASCRDVTMALVESLRRAMSESTVTWHIGESGVSIMGRCPSDTLSTTLTAISRITTSAILNSLTPSLISAFTQDANLGAANGGSRAGSVASSSQYPPTTTLARLAESAPGARLVVSQMLSQISDAANWKPATNTHSTVKPTALMRYLCRLVTPPGGVVLDPFMGSGSTGKAAVMEGFDFMGIEVEPEYYALAEARIAHAQEQHTPQLEFAL